MRAELHCDAQELDRFHSDWVRLADECSGRVTPFEEYRSLISDDVHDAGMRLIVVEDAGRVTAICPLVLTRHRKTYSVRRRRLITLPCRVLRLVGERMIGDIGDAEVPLILSCFNGRSDFDILSLGDVPLDSALFRGLSGVHERGKWRVLTPPHRAPLHWILDLPHTFDDYLAGFRAKQRNTLRRKKNKLARELGARLEVVTGPDEVARFLAEGARISRLTYQWDLGARLNDDEATRRLYAERAERGILRCYLLASDVGILAFMRGTLDRGIYYYETPGFDPAYSRWSPGTVLMLGAIEDLIESGHCQAFDFGRGGDASGYKSRFGNRSYESVVVEVVRRGRPYAALLASLNDGLSAAKRAGRSLRRWARVGTSDLQEG